MTPMAAITHVLVVDGDADICAAVQGVLEDAGYRVTCVQNGVEALVILRRTADPMIVLLELFLPRMDGAGVLRAATEAGLHPRHRFILISAMGSSGLRRIADIPGVREMPWVQKPFDIEVLLALIADQARAMAS